MEECYKCHKMGHPATNFGKKSNSNDDDDSSTSVAVNSVKKLQKDIKSMRKVFTMVNTQLEKLKEAESDISESEGEEEASYFQMDVALQFAQVEKKSSQESRNCSSKQFPRSRSTSGRSSFWIVSPIWIFSVMQPW
jgi:glutamine synthetase type III